MSEILGAKLKAIASRLQGFTIWRTRSGFQANLQKVGGSGWNIGFADDLERAVLHAIGSPYEGLSTEMVGQVAGALSMTPTNPWEAQIVAREAMTKALT